jgi:proton-coupled amino acid transporter
VIGFAIYSYEGIGVILPVRDITAKPEIYNKILLAVLLTVFFLYVFFGELCYVVYGDKLKFFPIILDVLPKEPLYNFAIISTVRVLFCINLIFTYPLVIYPANIIIESYLFGNMPKTKKR